MYYQAILLFKNFIGIPECITSRTMCYQFRSIFRVPLPRSAGEKSRKREHPSFPLLPLFPSLQTLILMPGE